MGEPLPMHRIQAAIFAFCASYPDAVVFGAQAVNIYVGDDSQRMTADVDILADAPEACAHALIASLREQLFLAARVRAVASGLRVYQVGPRHLADIRQMPFALTAVSRGGVRFVPLPLLAAMKVRALAARGSTAKGATDLADLRRLLTANPGLAADVAVDEALVALGASPSVRDSWKALRTVPIPDEAEDYE